MKIRHGRATVRFAYMGMWVESGISSQTIKLNRDARSHKYMSQNTSSAAKPSDFLTAPAPIPFSKLAPWLIFAGLVMLLMIYFVGAEEGATSIVPAMYVHD